jgi:cysteinyl-tRNA synthetase
MKIFDTLSGTKKELVNKSDGKPINLFVCGPTVYDYPHIGNARTFVMFDILIRYLRSRGFNIFYLQNITNVDDKIIQRAIDEKTT